MVRFGIVGSSGVVVNLGLLALFVELLGWHYAFASVLAIEASILTNYALNHIWTWRGGDNGLHTFLNFQLVSLVGMAIQWVVLAVGAALLDVHYMLAALAGIGLATIWNFAANHWFTFAEKSKDVVRRHRIGWMYAGAAVLQILAAALLVHSWDGFVFTRTVENFAANGETPYATAERDPAYVYANAQVPAFAQWYAYPPLAFLLQSLTYGPYFLAGFGNQMVGRLVLKLPIVAAALILPIVAKRFARATGANDRAAERIEKVLLFTPILLVIGAAWGQTEVLLGLFFVSSLYALAKNRYDLSAILFGLACLVKIFPLFVYPVLLAYLWGRRGFGTAFRHGLIAGVSALAVCVPFLIANPRGFFQVVVLMHYERPAGGFSPWMMPEWAVDQWLGTAARDVASTVLSIITFSAFLIFLTSQGLRAYRHDASVADMTRRLALSFLAFLLVSKVVHEQYMGLAALLLFVASFVGITSDERMARATHLLALAATFATLTRGLQIIQLIPPDEARVLFGATGAEIVERIRQSIGVTAGGLDFVTQSLGAGFLVYAMVRFTPLWRVVAETASDVARWLHKVPHPVPHWTSRKAYTAVVAAALILIPSAAVGILFPGSPPPTPTAPAALGSQALGAYYEVWWRNPSNDPFEQYGNWFYATTTPAQGYYSSRTGLFQDAVADMQSAGVDFALVPLNTRDSAAVRAFVYESQLAGFRFAFLYDIRWTQNLGDRVGEREGEDPILLPLRPDTFDDIRRYLERPANLLESEHMLTLDGKPTVFVQGLDVVQYQATLEEDRDIGDHLAKTSDAYYLTALYGNDAWVDDPEMLRPRLYTSSENFEAISALWSRAQREIVCEGWTDAFAPMLERIPDVQIILDESSVENACFPDVLVGGRFADWSTVRTGGSPVDHDVRFETIYPTYNASILRPNEPVAEAWDETGLAYATRWSQHLNSSYLLLHSWNAHQEGAAIEETLQYERLFADATLRWSQAAERVQSPTS